MRKTLFILLFSLVLIVPGLARGAEVRSVVIDSGHGGYDRGIRTLGVGEKDLMLKLARGLQREIEASGRFAFLSREVDHYMSIEDRRAAANKQEPDLFISLHMSSADSFTVYITAFEQKDADLDLSGYYRVNARQRRHIHESAALSRTVAETFKEGFAVNVYEREISIPLLDAIGAPAILVEMPSEGIDYNSEATKIILAIYRGILRYEQGR